MHKRRNNVRENISRNISRNEIYEKSYKNEASLMNELPNATAVAIVAASAITSDAALIKTNAPTEQSAD